MSDSREADDTGLDDLGLELQPETSPAQPAEPAGMASGPTEGAAVVGESAVQGQWVWQYGAPPPPPSFGAALFSGHAHKEHYRFLACALLVVLGCLLPWGPVETSGVEGPLLQAPPGVSGYATTTGAISLALGLWLLFAACYGIYTGRHKILPVFLMIEPAIVTWLRTLEAWGKLDDLDALPRLQQLFEVAGSGVLLTLVGSTWVAAGFLVLLGKVYAKKDDKGAARRASRGKDGDKGKEKDKAPARKGGEMPEEGKDPAPAAGEAPAAGGDPGDGEKKGRRGRRR